MGDRWLVLDCDYLCRRAFHAIGKVPGMLGNMITYTFLQEVAKLMNDHYTERVVFCFDGPGPGLRHGIYPDYKRKRVHKPDQMPPDEWEALQVYFDQRGGLRTWCLEAIGYRNVLWHTGYEADDEIAVVCQTLPVTEDIIIVTSDKDLYQCLRPNVRVYNPATGVMTTEGMFVDEWGLEPRRWPYVKAIAGCDTDDVPGVRGVGEKTAAKFLTNKLKPGLVTYKNIQAGMLLARQNFKLVHLPFKECPAWEYAPDEVTHARWAAVAAKLNIREFINLMPMSDRAARRQAGGILNR